MCAGVPQRNPHPPKPPTPPSAAERPGAFPTTGGRTARSQRPGAFPAAGRRAAWSPPPTIRSASGCYPRGKTSLDSGRVAPPPGSSSPRCLLPPPCSVLAATGAPTLTGAAQPATAAGAAPQAPPPPTPPSSGRTFAVSIICCPPSPCAPVNKSGGTCRRPPTPQCPQSPWLVSLAPTRGLSKTEAWREVGGREGQAATRGLWSTRFWSVLLLFLFKKAQRSGGDEWGGEQKEERGQVLPAGPAVAARPPPQVPAAGPLGRASTRPTRVRRRARAAAAAACGGAASLPYARVPGRRRAYKVAGRDRVGGVRTIVAGAPAAGRQLSVWVGRREGSRRSTSTRCRHAKRGGHPTLRRTCAYPPPLLPLAGSPGGWGRATSPLLAPLCPCVYSTWF